MSCAFCTPINTPLKILAGAYGTSPPVELPGSDECTWGPSHWCSSNAVAEKCGAEKWCTDNGMGVFAIGAPAAHIRSMVGTDPCTQGPAHWCASKANAIACGVGAVAHCLANGYADEQ